MQCIVCEFWKKDVNMNSAGFLRIFLRTSSSLAEWLSSSDRRGAGRGPGLHRAEVPTDPGAVRDGGLMEAGRGQTTHTDLQRQHRAKSIKHDILDTWS